MLARLKHKAQSQRGASLSMALLLMLVCVAISSIVLAAATASAGRVAEAGRYDQRYYAVTSAVRLFEASLKDGNEFTCTQTYGEGIDPDATLICPNDVPDTEVSGYDFLTALTCFALSGEVNETNAEEALRPMGGIWVEPFDSMNWDAALGSNDYAEGTYEIKMPSEAGVDADDTNLNVVVTARLRNDWSLELAFENVGTSDADRFSIFMLLQADVETEEHEREYSDPKTWERETSITWERVSIQQGRGFPDA